MKSRLRLAIPALLLLLTSCQLIQKHRDYPGPEGGIYWECYHYAEEGNCTSEIVDGHCIHRSFLNSNGNLDSTIDYTLAGRIERRTLFSYDPIDRNSSSDTYDSSGIRLFHKYYEMDTFGNVIYNEAISYVTFRDSSWFSGDEYYHCMVPQTRPKPDTSFYHSTWTYAGKKMTSESASNKKQMLLGQGWNNTVCCIHILNDTVLVEKTIIEPFDKYDLPSDSLQIKFGNGITADTLSFFNRNGGIEQRYTIHHNSSGLVIAITEENCPSVKDMCPPITHYFSYDNAGNLIANREQYNCSSPVCPKSAMVWSERKYDKEGKVIRFCCYTQHPLMKRKKVSPFSFE